MHGVQRPLSPHWIYRWQITMWLSSLHRITGLLLSLGAVVLGVWLIALASGPQTLTQSRSGCSARPGSRSPLIGWTFCFFFHLANGVRHLAWDAGHGFERSAFARRGWTVVLASPCVATAAFSFAAIL